VIVSKFRTHPRSALAIVCDTLPVTVWDSSQPRVTRTHPWAKHVPYRDRDQRNSEFFRVLVHPSLNITGDSTRALLILMSEITRFFKSTGTNSPSNTAYFGL
jgi:hypothetical protein